MSNKQSKMTNLASVAEADGSKDIGEAAWKAKLSAAQFRVLREKATDPRGMALDNCSGCQTPLYTSAMKFACTCGWPAFYDCLPKAVRAVPETDGSSRVEIVCNACNGHLGHVFHGEGFSNPTDERHCVNSTSLNFVAGSS